MELSTYDKVIVAFSGGKDSTACFLHLLDQGVPKEKIELWHHLIDGEPGSEPFMDWPMTEEYCQKFAEAFDVPIYFSWRHGGFFRELMKKQSQTAPVSWENPDGTIGTAGGTRGKVGDRRRWPMPAAKLEIRWCSSVLKIDVMSLAINNQERFLNSKTLVITGERAGESLNRAKYLHFQPHRCIAPTKGKIVHHWRPILEWDEAQVWSIIEKYKVNIFYTAPTAIRAFMKWGVEHPQAHDLSSLRILGTVGEPINPEAWIWYHKNIGGEQCAIVDTWWQTETGGILISPQTGAIDLKPGSATKPFFGIRPVIVDKDGKTLKGECTGRLCIAQSWPGQMRTVYGDHQRFIDTYFSQFEGKYFTGDGCRRDKDGYYWITGRVDDVIIVSGHNLGTAEIESAFVAHSKVAEAAVVG